MFVSGRGIVRYRTVDGWNPAPPAIYETLWNNGIFSRSQLVSLPDFWLPSTPIGSMYGIFPYIWLILMVNVDGSYGIFYGYRQTISTFSGYTLQMSWHLGFGCWGFGWFLTLDEDRFGVWKTAQPTFVENEKHQHYTTHGSVLYDIVASCVCIWPENLDRLLLNHACIWVSTIVCHV